MGYHLDFIFDEGMDLDSEAVVELFCSKGCTVIEDDSRPERVRENFINLYYPELTYPITVRMKREDVRNDAWAFTRLSWGERAFVRVVEKFLDLAELTACRLYDPQCEDYLTASNIQEVAADFYRSCLSVRDTFGEIDDEPA